MMDHGLLHDATVWVLFSFIIFLGLAWVLGRRAVVDALDKRIEAIRDELRTAENLRIEAQELLAQYQRKFRNATKEAEGIVSQAHEHAARIRAKAESDLAETVRRKEVLLESRLKSLEAAALHDLRVRAAQLAIQAAEQMIRKTIDEKVNAEIVQTSLNDLSRRIVH